MVDPSVIWVLAFLVTLTYSIAHAQRESLDPMTMFWAGVWGILGSLSGGHLICILGDFRTFMEDPLLFFRFLERGKGVFGAFFGAGVLGWGYLRWKKTPFLSYSDTAATAIALGYAIARIGCFVNGDDFGTVSTVPWAVRFPQGTEAFFSHVEKGWITSESTASLPVHPTQLYHVAAGFLLFYILRQWKGAWAGSRLGLALAGYGISRFFLQFLRGDSVPVIAGLDDAQIFSLLFIGAAALLWFQQGRKQRAADPVRTAPASPGISFVNVQ